MRKKLLALALIGSLALSQTGCMYVVKNILNNTEESTEIIDDINIDDLTDDYVEEDTEDTEDIDVEDDIDVEEDDTESTETDKKLTLIDEVTGKDLYKLVTHDYYDSYSATEEIFAFVEPEGWTVDTEYLDDQDGHTGTQIFLDNESRDTIEISCLVRSGLLSFYEPDDDSELAERYELVETGHVTNLNPYGYDIYKYNYQFDDGSTSYNYVAILYAGDETSLVITFPDSYDCEEFTELDQVTSFLETNF